VRKKPLSDENLINNFQKEIGFLYKIALFLYDLKESQEEE